MLKKTKVRHNVALETATKRHMAHRDTMYSIQKKINPAAV